MNLEEQWQIKKEMALAWIRFAFSVVAIAVINLSPPRQPWFPLLSYLSIYAFWAYSVLLLYLLRRWPYAFGKREFVTVAADLLWVSLIVLSTRGSRSPFFVFYLFPVFIAGFRFGLRGSLPVALLGVVLYGLIRYFSLDFRPIRMDSFLIRCTYLFTLAYIVGYLSEFESRQNQKLMALYKTAAEAAVQEERRRIVRALHDRLLQVLASTVLRLEACRKHFLPDPREMSRELQSMEATLRDSMGEIRLFLGGKDSPELVPGSLIDHLSGEELKFLRNGLGLQVTLDVEPEPLALPVEVEQELYYVFREALMNVAKHAQASAVEVSLKQSNSAVRGSVKDNGVGFEPAAAYDNGRYGLKGMEERIYRLGGEITIDSSPGSGTHVNFHFPVDNHGPTRQEVT